MSDAGFVCEDGVLEEMTEKVNDSSSKVPIKHVLNQHTAIQSLLNIRPTERFGSLKIILQIKAVFLKQCSTVY